MAPNTRARTGTHSRPSDRDPPQERQKQRKASGARRARQRDGTGEQTDNGSSQLVGNETVADSRPLPHGGSRPTQTPPSTSAEPQPNGGRPSLSMNPIRNTRMGEAFHPQPAPPPTSFRLPNTSADQAGPSFTPSHSSPQPRLPPPLPSQSMGPTPACTIQNRQKMRRKPRGMTAKGLKQSMGLHKDQVSRNAYNRFRDRVRVKMKEKGEGLWLTFDDVPRCYKDWLVNEIMNDRSIPFIREYGEWAVLAAARRTTAGWRKHRYRDHTLEVPENKRYLAANAAKRSPNTPRGARFPACPSKRNRTPTTDDDDSQDDGRIPILPPGPSTTSDLAGFPNGGVTWDSGFPSQRPIQPVPGPSQLPFSGFGPFPQAQTSTTPSAVPWDWTDPQNLASSGAPMNVSYWECSPSSSSGLHPPDVQLRAPGLDGFGQGPPHAPILPQHHVNQPAEPWMVTPPGTSQESFSAPYRFTPDNSDMDDEEHCRRPPNQEPHPRRRVGRHSYNEPRSRPPNQGPPRMDGHDLC